MNSMTTAPTSLARTDLPRLRGRLSSVSAASRLRAAVLALLALAAFAGRALAQDAAAESSERRFNVLWIISDDQRWTDYGFMGHPRIKTPEIDALAKQSLLFRRGYVPTSLCCPSLATMLTGRYPHQHGITSNEPMMRRGTPRDEFLRACEEMDSRITRGPALTRILAKHGYLSLQTGKWWHGSYRLGGFSHGMTHGDPKRGGRHGDVGLTIGRKGLAAITEFWDLAKRENKPWFVWYAPFLPHSPHTPPKRLLDKYRERSPSIAVARYEACCEWFDETCGELLRELDKRGQADNTIVVYVCDNGWIQDPRRPNRFGPRSKQSPYDGGVRTPIFVRFPKALRDATAKQGQSKGDPEQRERQGDGAQLRSALVGESKALATSLDLVPTTLAALGIEIPKGLPGIDLRDKEAREARRFVAGQIYLHDARSATRPGASLRYRWLVHRDGHKLILPHKPNVPDGPIELFDLLSDPHETKNLAEQRWPRVVALRKLLNGVWRP